MRRRLVQILAAGATLAVVLCVTSSAAALPGPSSLSTGFVDYPVFQSTSASLGSLWFGRARGLGARWVRLSVYWAKIAPQQEPPGFNPLNPRDPGYAFSTLDQSVREAAAAGQSVVMTVVDAPQWAEGSDMPTGAQPGAWRPSPSALAGFAHALALRYSGRFPDPLNSGRRLPLVSYFQAWNEPNLPVYVEPQWVSGPHGSILPASPDIYRPMLNAFYAAVKQVQPHSFVLAAGTAPYGDPPSATDRMAPALFLRELFCLTSSLRATACPDPPHLDALDHHPYSLGPTVKALQPDDISVPDLGKIFRIARAAERVHHVEPAGPKPLWITEIDWSTHPLNAATGAKQTRETAETFYEFWAQGVGHVFWFEIRDPLAANTTSFNDSGLYTRSGVAKPATAAYRFPFVALPVPHNTMSILWGRAPQAGTVAIQELVRSRWRAVMRLRTTSGGIFYAKHSVGKNVQLRAVIGRFRSPAFRDVPG